MSVSSSRNPDGGHLAIGHWKRTGHKVKQAFGKAPMPHTSDTFRGQSRDCSWSLVIQSPALLWGGREEGRDPHYCPGNRGPISWKQERKCSSTGFGGAGQGSVAKVGVGVCVGGSGGSRGRDVEEETLKRRGQLGEWARFQEPLVRSSSYAQGWPLCRVRALTLPLSRHRGH